MAESERFGPYHVHECLGAGGMAIVHRATIELEDGDIREVALKRLLPQFADDKRFVDDLIREGKLAAHLEHPGIVRILELGRIGRTYFIAMDLVRGRSLVTVMVRCLQKQMRPSIGVVLALMYEMLIALDHAHAAQIVHRDLTPSNLIVTDDGHLKIIDFGVAKALVGVLQTSSGLAKGKLGYMSSEALSGKRVDQRTDIFSAGVVMWELLALRRLFFGDTDIEIIQAVRSGEIEPASIFNDACPAELDDIILRALARSREERWTTAGEMADAIAELRAYYPATARDVVAWMDELYLDTETELRPFAYDDSSQYMMPPAPESSTYEEFRIEMSPDDELLDDIGDVTEQPTQATSKFLDMDTVISTYHDRKR